ncbi:MAG TPA: preprotein translocase subunit SecG [Candidatus Limnocylindria bacterium]|nr:preprotein translocase subunit SecG [Candidatus Limnocylindria bacterium]
MAAMTTVQVIFSVLLMLSALALIISVLLQKGDEGGISALTGGQSAGFLGKNKGKTAEGRLALLTKVFASVFVVLAMVLIFL